MSGTVDRRRKAEKIRHLLATDGETIHENTTVFNQDRIDTVAGFDEFESLRDRARAIKERSIDELPSLIEQLRERVEDNGGHLYLAEDAADANRYVAQVASDVDAETVVKSKSMTTEELETNDALEKAGADVYETDLGEFVIQVADESPSHIVGPSLHKSSEEIADLFNDAFETDEPLETPAELTAFARDYLGEKIAAADLGITGANFVVSETGTITLITNEGNARKTAVTPNTHVAVAGVEKVIPSVEDLRPFVELISKTATGQDISQYVSMFTPPTDSPTVDFDRPDEPLGSGDADRDFHLVLVDNGRMDMREDDHLRETLYCIRCGACANSCANFQQVGGHGFGGETYSGGIATGWETGVHGDDAAGDFNDLCTGCTRCVNACPVKIDIPWINTVVRDRLNANADPSDVEFLVEGLTPDAESEPVPLQKRLFGNYGTLAKLGSAFAPLSNWVADLDPVRTLLDEYVGVSQERALPTFQRTTLEDWFAARSDDGPASPDRTVVLYPDAYTNYVLVERGKAAVRTLEALGVAVRLGTPIESGRAALSQGMVSTATQQARRVADDLSPALVAGHDVVVIEPSDLAMFRREYERLLDRETYERLAENSYDVMEYVHGLLGENGGLDALADPDEPIAYHSHCQQRTLGLESYTEAVFEELGFDVDDSDAECCGMAGSFGYKSEYYELSMAVGDDLVDEFEDPAARTLVASGTSCTEQMDALFSGEVVHPIEVVAPDR